jgi:glycerol uptake facilitator-like aquaporin
LLRLTSEASLSRKAGAEAIGTAFLLAAIVGSGIMAETLSAGNMGLVLLANTVATSATLVVLILTFGATSGAHFNPAVTFAAAWTGDLDWKDIPAFWVAQLVGAVAGVMLAHAMFGAALLQVSEHARSGSAQALSEFVATFGLLLVVRHCARSRPDAAPVAIGLYIAGAYWFTASTSFANPAVTLARAASDTFAGIRPADALPLILAQLLGTASAAILMRWLIARAPREP